MANHTRTQRGSQPAPARPVITSHAANGDGPKSPNNRATVPVIVTGKQLRDVTRDALDALKAANHPPTIFVRGGELVRVRSDECGRPVLEVLTEAALRGQLARAATFVRVKSDGTPVHVPPPLNVVRDILALGDWPFPPLAGITEAPMLRPDGTILDRPGYDSATRLLYVPAPGLTVSPIPNTPSSEEVGRACVLIEEALHDFPFTEDASRANAFAALLTPIVGPAILGRTPLFLFDAPSMGTGKSTLAELVGVIVADHGVGMLPEPEDDAEWRKRLTAIFSEGHSVVVLDDVKRRLDSPILAMAITAEIWRDRLLGTNRTISIANRAVFIVTGNNLRLGGDMARRCVWVRLDAKIAQPWRRTDFRHPNLMSWAREHRGELLGALHTLARAWWVAGCPEAPVAPFAGFQEWARIVGGILAHAGVSGFLGNLGQMYAEVDEGTAQFEHFLRAWHETYGSTPVRTTQVAEDIRLGTSPLRDTLPDTLAEVADERTKGKFVQRLGNLLRRRTDVRHGVDSIRVERAGSGESFGGGAWRVVRDGQEPDRPPAPSSVPPQTAGQEDVPERLQSLAGDDGRRAWVLAMGKALSYPVLEHKGWKLIAPGNLAWENVCARSNDDYIKRAVEALEASGAEGMP